jgi:hypothetical protein
MNASLPTSRMLRPLVMLLAVLCAAPALAQPMAAPGDETYRAAIFVRDRVEEVPDEKVDVLASRLSARVADAGFAIIDRADVVNAVAELADAGANRGLDADDPEAVGKKLDELLSDQTSAVRLAQALDADYILMVNLDTYGEDTRDFDNGTIRTRIIEYRLRSSFRLLDIATGEGLTGDVVDVSIRKRAAGGLEGSFDAIDDLLDETSDEMAQKLVSKKRENRIAPPNIVGRDVPFTIRATIADLTIPEIVRNDDGELVITANRYQPQPLAVTVILDGLTVGDTTNPELRAAPGLHTFRLERDGFVWTVAMEMTDENAREFRERTEWLQELKTNQALTDAEVERLRGMAQALRQSGVKIDVKIDTDEAPEQIGGTRIDELDLDDLDLDDLD